MKRILLFLFLLFPNLAFAQNYTATQGAGTTFGAKLVTAVLYPQQLMCDPTTPAQCVAVNASGQITITNTSFAATQGTSPWVVSNGGTFAVQATQSGTWNVANAGTFAVQAAQTGTWTVQPGNTANTTAWLVTGTGGTFPATQSGTWTNTVTQATGTNLHMVCDSGCSGSGGTSSNFGSAFPTAGTAIGLTNGTNMVAWSATTNYGTAPSAIAVPAVNAFVTNSNANGSAVSASSSPVVIASDQAAVAVKAAASALAVNAFAGESTTGNISVNNTTAVVVKASAGTVYGIQLANIGTVPLYLKLYNATSATCGSGTPVKRLVIPVNSTAANAAGSNISFGPQGVAFATGITYCLTGGITDADTTAPAASVGLVNIDWN